MSGAGRTIHIAGAGIAGLTLALALAKFGATVVVLERAADLQTEGAGLQISPNARKVLNRLGLDRALTAASFEPTGIDVYPHTRRAPIITLRLGEDIERKFGAPYAVMHRADLQQALYKACRRFANIDVQFGVESFDLVTHARGITLHIDTGKGESRTARPFAFVGADGVHSRTRQVLLDGEPAEYSGLVAWRALADVSAMSSQFALDRSALLFGPGYHAVVYPLPHRKKFNIVLFQKMPEKRAFGPNPPIAPRLAKSMIPSRHFDAIARAVGDNWTFWPAFAVQSDTWHHGPVGLIGDAAHAMLPFQAQGGAMAIEDAAILAPLLMTEPNAESAFSRYHNLRRDRVRRVARISSRNGFAFHLEWPFSIARDLAVALQGENGHFDRLDWLYGYDPAPDIDILAPERPPEPPRA
jgi:salicylate hydroxylase